LRLAGATFLQQNPFREQAQDSQYESREISKGIPRENAGWQFLAQKRKSTLSPSKKNTAVT
jgi:hypothetical protein